MASIDSLRCSTASTPSLIGICIARRRANPVTAAAVATPSTTERQPRMWLATIEPEWTRKTREQRGQRGLTQRDQRLDRRWIFVRLAAAQRVDELRDLVVLLRRQRSRPRAFVLVRRLRLLGGRTRVGPQEVALRSRGELLAHRCSGGRVDQLGRADLAVLDAAAGRGLGRSKRGRAGLCLWWRRNRATRRGRRRHRLAAPWRRIRGPACGLSRRKRSARRRIAAGGI